MAVVHNGAQVVIKVPEGASEGDVIQVSIPRQPAPQAQPVAQVSHMEPMQIHATAIPANAVAVQAVPYNPHGGNNQSQSGYVVQVASGSDLEYAEKLLRSRAWVSCFAMMDVFLIILSIFTRLGWFGLLLLIGPLYGYYGARSLNPMNVLVYFVFKIVHTLIYFFTMLASDSSSQFVWSLLLVLCEIYITWEVFKFWKMLKNIDEQALMRAMQQLHQHQHHYQGGRY